jgi:RNA polymerase sigma-70 factor, ECF subfamily
MSNSEPDTQPYQRDSQSISSTLLHNVQSRDPAAWQRLVALYTPEIYRWCRQAGLQEQDAADISQEVFSRVATHVSGFRREHVGDTFRGWLATIARNLIMDHFRRRRHKDRGIGGSTAQERISQLPEPSDGTESFHPQKDVFGLDQALDRIQGEFEKKTWQAFRRMLFGGETAAEIAQDLGMTPKGVRQAKYRVLKRLREVAGRPEDNAAEA